MGIAYQNKDIMFKVLSQHYKNKSLAVYGLNVPRIKHLLPSDYPTVTATETHADNTFLLEDDSLLLLEYESTAKKEDFIKYTKYAANALERLYKEGVKVKRLIIAVIYTGDVKKASHEYDMGALRIKLEQVFLSKFDTVKMHSELKAKIDEGEYLNDDDIMKLVILPLTQPDKSRKQKLIEDTIELAKKVQDENQQLFAIAGILTATDKFIDQEYSEMVKGWIKMTKVARLFEEEKIEAVNKVVRLFEEEKVDAMNKAAKLFEKEKIEAVNKTLINERLRFAKDMLAFGEDPLKIMQITKLSRSELESLI